MNSAPFYGAAGLDVRGITADSRAVSPGDLFAALPGLRADGRAFIAEAVERGACAVLAPEGTEWPAGVPPRPMIRDPQPRRLLARMAARLAGPQPHMLVAVTGTNGKTSTVDFLRQLWGPNAASLGTLGLITSPPPLEGLSRPGSTPGEGSSTSSPPPPVGGGRGEGSPAMNTATTTPDPVALAHTLAALARAGTHRVAMEASSHGLDQFRLDGAQVTAAAFTNLTRDHLDYHHTMEAYRAAKLRLFSELLPVGAPAIATTALDADTLQALRDIARRRRLDFRLVGEGGDWFRLADAIPLPHGQDLTLILQGIKIHIHLPLIGRFQADNALLAASLAHATGLPDAFDRLPNLAGVRGRMELAARLPNGAVAYVDYAHTPDALQRLLAALRPHTAGRLHIVFGAGGDRDPGKRPHMGAAALAADRIVVTDDNPRTEDPAAIRAAVMAACPHAAEIGDREAAIAAALSDLRPGDVLVVAGKGHEPGQTIGTTTLPFDDAEVIRRLTGAAL